MVLHDAEEEGPVLTLADGRHLAFAAYLRVIHRREATDLIVVLEFGERQLLGSHDETINLALLIAGEIGREGEGTAPLLHEGYLAFELHGQPTVVAIAEGDVTTLCHLDGVVASITGAFVLRHLQDTDAGIAHSIGMQDILSTVGRTIVGNQQFPVGVSLSHNALYAPTDIGGRIIGRHDDRDKFLHVVTNE